jgi:hypothetical protein
MDAIASGRLLVGDAIVLLRSVLLPCVVCLFAPPGWLKTVDQYFMGANNSIQHAGVQVRVVTPFCKRLLSTDAEVVFPSGVGTATRLATNLFQLPATRNAFHAFLFVSQLAVHFGLGYPQPGRKP